MMFLPALAVVVAAAMVAWGLGKLLRVREEPFLAGLAGAVISELLVLVALTPLLFMLSEHSAWLAAPAIIALVGEAVRVHFAFRAADSLNEVWDLLSFGLAGALLGGVSVVLEFVVDRAILSLDIWSVVAVLTVVSANLVRGASIAAFVRARWPWWTTWLLSAAATFAVLIASRVHESIGWTVYAVTLAILLGLAYFASRNRVSSVTTPPPHANTPRHE
jgi:hypothetical protein